MNTPITLLGRACTVTDPNYLVETGTLRMSFDCRNSQGGNQLRFSNWASLLAHPAGTVERGCDVGPSQVNGPGSSMAGL